MLEENNVCICKSADFSRSLYKLRLKSVQTTRVVCTNFAECSTLGNAYSIFCKVPSVVYLVVEDLYLLRDYVVQKNK